MVTLKSRNRGGNSTPLYASLLAVLIVGVVACQIVLAQPAPERPLDQLDRPKKAPVATPAPAAPAAAASAEAAPVEAAPKAEPKYDEDPVDESSTMKKNRFAVLQILRTGRFAGGDQAMFDEFYGKLALPRWTLVKTITRDADYRKELHNDLQLAKNGPVHDRLNTLTLEYMNKLVAGRYHPFVQVNAMLMIGELNAAEQGPTPLPAALEVLIAAVGNAKLSDGIRAAAMVGILRHAALGIEDEEARRSLTAAMLKVVATADPPGVPAAGPVTAGREWICRQAVDTLGRLGLAGENNAVYNAMLKTVADAKLSFSTRSTAAESLGRLNYTGAAGINAVEAAAKLGQFLIDACIEELRLATANADIDPLLLRRWMKQRLAAAKMALTGLEGNDESRKGIGSLAKEGEQRAFVDALRSAIQAKMDFLDDPKLAEEDLTPQVEELQKALEAWLQKKPK